MTPAARLSAAIEVFAAIESERRPAADALKAWGLAHRFAGSGDRAAIAGLVYDALRRRASSAFLMRRGWPTRHSSRHAQARARARCGGDRAGWRTAPKYAPVPLSDDERRRLETGDLAGAPPHVAGDYPEWLDPQFAQSFGDERAEEGAALASRAPLDLRVNL